MKTKIIIPNAVKRKEGYLYYIDGQGNIRQARTAEADDWRRKNKKIIYNSRGI